MARRRVHRPAQPGRPAGPGASAGGPAGTGASAPEEGLKGLRRHERWGRAGPCAAGGRGCGQTNLTASGRLQAIKGLSPRVDGN